MKSCLQRNAGAGREFEHPKATKLPDVPMKLQSASISLVAATDGIRTRAEGRLYLRDDDSIQFKAKRGANFGAEYSGLKSGVLCF